MTSKTDIRRWLREGRRHGATHVIVVCDKFSYEDYPVYIHPGTSVHDKIRQYNQNMQRVMEVYSLRLPLDAQVDEPRAYHTD